VVRPAPQCWNRRKGGKRGKDGVVFPSLATDTFPTKGGGKKGKKKGKGRRTTDAAIVGPDGDIGGISLKQKKRKGGGRERKKKKKREKEKGKKGERASIPPRRFVASAKP